MGVPTPAGVPVGVPGVPVTVPAGVGLPVGAGVVASTVGVAAGVVAATVGLTASVAVAAAKGVGVGAGAQLAARARASTIQIPNRMRFLVIFFLLLYPPDAGHGSPSVRGKLAILVPKTQKRFGIRLQIALGRCLPGSRVQGLGLRAG